MFQEIINSAFKDIVSDELKKIEDSSRNLSGNPTVTRDSGDILWEYEGLNGVYEGDSEEILLEMQQIFYKDLVSETTTVNGIIPFNYFLYEISNERNYDF